MRTRPRRSSPGPSRKARRSILRLQFQRSRGHDLASRRQITRTQKCRPERLLQRRRRLEVRALDRRRPRCPRLDYRQLGTALRASDDIFVPIVRMPALRTNEAAVHDDQLPQLRLPVSAMNERHDAKNNHSHAAGYCNPRQRLFLTDSKEHHGGEDRLNQKNGGSGELVRHEHAASDRQGSWDSLRDMHKVHASAPGASTTDAKNRLLAHRVGLLAGTISRNWRESGASSCSWRSSPSTCARLRRSTHCTFSECRSTSRCN